MLSATADRIRPAIIQLALLSGGLYGFRYAPLSWCFAGPNQQPTGWPDGILQGSGA
jgi:hypothetical protein